MRCTRCEMTRRLVLSTADERATTCEDTGIDSARLFEHSDRLFAISFSDISRYRHSWILQTAERLGVQNILGALHSVFPCILHAGDTLYWLILVRILRRAGLEQLLDWHRRCKPPTQLLRPTTGARWALRSSVHCPRPYAFLLLYHATRS